MVSRRPRRPPDRGDVVRLTFDPQAGHEQTGRRPALVLSPAAYNAKVGLALVCPITNQAKGYPFEVPLPDDFPDSGVVISDQLRSLDWRARDAQRIVSVSEEVVAEVASRVMTLLPSIP